MEQQKLNDAEIALMDAIKSLIEIMLARHVATGAEFDHIFSFQRDGYLKKQMPTAAAVMEMLREFSSTRSEHRGLLEKPPAGSA